MKSEQLLNSVLKDGMNLTVKECQEFLVSMSKAIADRHVYVIRKDGNEVGFMSYEPDGDKVFIDKLYIYSPYRSRKNLLNLREIFRDAFNGKRFYGYLRKRNRVLDVK